MHRTRYGCDVFKQVTTLNPNKQLNKHKKFRNIDIPLGYLSNII